METFVDNTRQINQLQTVIKKQLEATGKRPSKLEQLLKALLTIPPTSVEAEQAFSAAGLFATKLRSRLSDKSVVVVNYPTPSEGWGMAEDHGAPEAGKLSRVWTRGRIETESRQRVSGAKRP